MSAPLIALKVDVDTLRGTLEGVPRLLELFRQKNYDQLEMEVRRHWNVDLAYLEAL